MFDKELFIRFTVRVFRGPSFPFGIEGRMWDVTILLFLGKENKKHNFLSKGGWSGGAMVLGNLPVPGRPAYLD